MPHVNYSWDEQPDVRVVVIDGQGRYLAESPAGLYFSEKRSLALVLRYLADHVEEQLAKLYESSGIELIAEPVQPEEVYETCDHCKELFMPHMTFFDGQLFLCGECREAQAALRVKRRTSSAQPSALNI